MRKVILLLIIAVTLTGCSNQTIAKAPEVDKPVIEVSEPVQVYPIYDIPMSAELQRYTFDLCQLKNLGYELVLGVIHTESKFDPKAQNGGCKGLMQISPNTGVMISREIPWMVDYDPFAPKQNIAVGVYYLAYLRDYWEAEGCSDKDVFSLMLISYNRGVTGCREYVKKYGLDNEYVDKVYDFKTKLEKGEDLHE